MSPAHHTCPSNVVWVPQNLWSRRMIWRKLKQGLIQARKVAHVQKKKEKKTKKISRRGLRFIILIREDADVITKAALSPQLFKDPEYW